LKAQDAGRAYRAVWTLTAAGDAAAALLEKRLEPAAAGGRGGQIRQLVADLDADTFATREAASRQLGQFGAEAESALANALSRSPSPEVRARAEALLKQMAGGETAPTAEEVRVGRALVVLERVGSARCRRLLDRLGGGDPDAWQTIMAKCALTRLSRRAAATQAGVPN